ncbi:MAG: ankyrin repeat domain-containing protein [Gemmatimonadaceae bacterium]
MTTATDPHSAFIEAACVPIDQRHVSGTLDRANEILAAHPDVARASIYVAAILGNDDDVRTFLERDRASGTVKGGPYHWDALTHLCFSRFLRLDRTRSDGFVQAATALLDAGANANTGWFETTHQPDGVFESAIYGTAGVAHHAELTRLLLERGADPNDDETPYHAAEGYDNAAMQVLVASGKMNADSLTTLLIRKADWHDAEGIRWLLAQGADPNRMTRWGRTALFHAVQRDNDLAIIEAMLAHGGDPSIPSKAAGVFSEHRLSTSALAARRGRGDVLAALERHGKPVALQGLDALLAACARDDSARIESLVEQEPALLEALRADGGRALAEFSGVGNSAGVRQLLDLGVDVSAPYASGNPYFDIARGSQAIHVAAWRAQHDTLQLLLERGSPVDTVDGNGRTPLALAIRACVDSYWSEDRVPTSVRALLDAGASVHGRGVVFPSGYEDVDALLRARGA